MTATIVYEGNLRTRCKHLDSGTEIITDAPKDNHGNGEAFSPTDLVATALGSCMLSIMGIKARQMELALEGTEVEITKVMVADPRRIGEIIVNVRFPKKDFSDKDKKILENSAMTCPVFLSLHPDVKKTVEFIW